jgi:hypothetical protein
MAISLLLSENQNGSANSANKIPKPIETMIKSINHATNLSAQLANMTSTEPLSAPPVLDSGGEPLFDEAIYG